MLKLQSGIDITKLSKRFVTDLKSLTLHSNVKNILGDPGAVSGGGRKSKRAIKKFGRRKVKNE